MWLSPNEVCIGVAVSVNNICARFITVSVKKLLHYRAGGLLQYRAVLLHYRAVITVSGVFITLSGSYYSIGRLLHYRLVQLVSFHVLEASSMHRKCLHVYFLSKSLPLRCTWWPGHLQSLGVIFAFSWCIIYMTYPELKVNLVCTPALTFCLSRTCLHIRIDFFCFHFLCIMLRCIVVMQLFAQWLHTCVWFIWLRSVTECTKTQTIDLYMCRACERFYRSVSFDCTPLFILILSVSFSVYPCQHT